MAEREILKGDRVTLSPEPSKGIMGSRGEVGIVSQVYPDGVVVITFKGGCYTFPAQYHYLIHRAPIDISHH